jgi:class 3 adenylate cyclase
MEEHGNKTIMCSVLFLDIVEYSRKSVAAQISLKDRFNNYLSAAIRGVPMADRIILDTGDGAAINFLGDVEDALKAALSLRESLLNEDRDLEPPLLVRMGVNLGPVRLVRDINGQPNIVGDGINVAQRVMGFADPSQILVSRSYYDAVSRLSPTYAGMFHYQGSRTDKHVREHEVYAIGYPGESVVTQEQSGIPPETSGKLGAALVQFQDIVQFIAQHLNSGVQTARTAFLAAPMSQRALYAGLLIVPIMLVILLMAKMPNHDAAVGTQPDATEKPGDMSQAAIESAVPPSDVVTDKSAALADKTPEAVAKVGPKKTPTTDVGGTAQVRIAVAPWGEVYLDGMMQGISPPLAELKVSPGKHRIEIYNAAFPVYVRDIQVKAGDKIKIKYKFAN